MKQQEEQPPPLAVTVKEAARLLSVSEFTIRRVIKAGRIHIKRINTTILIERSELERFLRESGNGL